MDNKLAIENTNDRHIISVHKCNSEKLTLCNKPTKNMRIDEVDYWDLSNSYVCSICFCKPIDHVNKLPI